MEGTVLLAGGWGLAASGAFLLWLGWRWGSGPLTAVAAALLAGSAILFTLPQSVERGLAFFIPAFVLAAGTLTYWQSRLSPPRTARELAAGPAGGGTGLTITRTGAARTYLAVCGAPAIAAVLTWLTLQSAPMEFANKLMLAMGVMIVSFAALLVIILAAARLAPLLLASIAALALIIGWLLT